MQGKATKSRNSKHATQAKHAVAGEGEGKEVQVELVARWVRAQQETRNEMWHGWMEKPKSTLHKLVSSSADYLFLPTSLPPSRLLILWFVSILGKQRNLACHQICSHSSGLTPSYTSRHDARTHLQVPGSGGEGQVEWWKTSRVASRQIVSYVLRDSRLVRTVIIVCWLASVDSLPNCSLRLTY